MFDEDEMTFPELDAVIAQVKAEIAAIFADCPKMRVRLKTK